MHDEHAGRGQLQALGVQSEIAKYAASSSEAVCAILPFEYAASSHVRAGDAGIFRFRIGRQAPEAGLASVLVMHPGPMNRGVEIASDVATVRAPSSGTGNNGVAVRMAVLASIAATLTRHRRPL